MNLKEEILARYNNEQALKIAAYACKSQKNFKELMNYFLGNDYRLAQRAAWNVNWAAKQNPAMIAPYIKDLVGVLGKPNMPNSVIRTATKILEKIELPKEYEGQVMNTCFEWIQSPTMPAAIKAFSLTILDNLCKDYPEILPELQLIITERWDIETPAFKARGRKF
jgi:hypothetical protein